MSSINATSENRFKINFTNYNSLNATAISGQIPEISQASTLVQYNGCEIKVPGDNYKVGDLNILFKLSEDYSNYLIIYNWIQNNRNAANNNDSSSIIYDTIDYMILDTRYKPILSFVYSDVFPVTIDQIDHTTQTASADELEFNVTFSVGSITPVDI